MVQTMILVRFKGTYSHSWKEMLSRREHRRINRKNRTIQELSMDSQEKLFNSGREKKEILSNGTWAWPAFRLRPKSGPYHTHTHAHLNIIGQMVPIQNDRCMKENLKVNVSHWIHGLKKEQFVNREIRRPNMIDWNELTVFAKDSVVD